jgi:DNA-binding MarR family transcriptional regulator
MKAPVESLFLENQLCFPLYAASRLTTKLYAPLLAELDLTYPQYLVLMVLWEKQEQTVKQICQVLYLETNTVTPLLKRLEQKELLTRKRSKKDERTVHVQLTKKGKLLQKKALLIPHKIISSFNDEKLPESNMKTFQETLFQLVEVLSEKAS